MKNEKLKIENEQPAFRRSIFNFSFLIFHLALCLSGRSFSEDSDLRVQAAGLRVVKAVQSSDERLQAFSAKPGTTVTLLVTSESGGFVSMDYAASSVNALTDDKGNDLLNSKTGLTQALSPSAIVSRDAKACTVEVSAPSTPAKGSAALKLSGTISMLSASAKTEVVQKDIPVKNGSKISTPDVEMTLEKVGKPDVGDEPLSLTLHASKSLDSIAEIKFFRPDGKEIKSRSAGIAKMGVLGSLTVEWTFNLAENADALTAKVYFWTDLKKKKVDFDLNVQVGL